MKKTLLTIAAALACTAAHAELLDRVDLSPALVSGFVTHHINVHTTKYNEFNYGIGYRFASPSIIVGVYHNSDYKTSFYAGYEARWRIVNHLEVGAVAGLVSGYKHHVVLPLLMPEVVVTAGRFELAGAFSPHIADMPALVTAQLRFKF